MPYPAQVTLDSIVTTARDLIEADGYEAVTLAKLATALNIKAPSLYNHVKSKTDLLRLLNTVTNRELTTAVLNAALQATEPPRQIMAMATAYRSFVQQHPVTYGLAYSANVPEATPDPAELEKMAIPLQRIWVPIVGEADSLTALRGGLALIHGFVALELNGQFRRSGDLTDVFEQIIRIYLGGWLARG